MTVIGLDDTDSRERGMCTTYAAALAADCLRERGATVERLLLVRLNPAVEYKTRGNAALAVHTDADPGAAFDLVADVIDDRAETGDERTNPGLVVLDGDPEALGPRDALARFARSAVRDRLSIEDSEALLARTDCHHAGWGDGRGRIGALAAVGAWSAFDDGGAGPTAGNEADADWTHERIAYRERDRWGTPRDVDRDSVFAAADDGYPEVWDTVDRGSDEVVCVPRTPGPVLYGIRGESAAAVESAAAAVEAERIERAETFLTNQGTDVHLRTAPLSDVLDGRAYRTTGRVAGPPETRRGGHVFVPLAAASDGESGAERDAGGAEAAASDPPAGPALVRCAAFEPTKRFRDRVRALRPGDRITACGEFTADAARGDPPDDGARGTLKLEKFAVRGLVTVERVTPECPDCGRRMESAGRGQGYRCRDCSTSADGKAERALDRALEPGWYEVPPRARRHIAEPLVRGGFDAPTHPER